MNHILLSFLFLNMIDVASGALCTLCANGNTPANGNETVPYGDTNLTCAAIDSSLRAGVDSTSANCIAAQSGLGSVCGCSIGMTSVCTLCSNGGSPSNANLSVPYGDTTLTCAAIDSSLRAGVDSTSANCVAAQSGLGSVCGCSIASTTNITQYCSLCPDGKSPSNANLVMPPYNYTCATIDFGLKTTVSSSNSSCAVAQASYSTPCGCPSSNINTTTNATTNSTPALCAGLCSSGKVLTNPTRLLPPIPMLGGATLNCATADALFKGIPAASDYCKTTPIIGGEYCGCPNPPPSCTPCYNNSIMPNFSTPIPGLSMTCGDLALATAIKPISNATGQVNQTECSAYQLLGYTYCKCPVAPPLASSSTSSRNLFVTSRVIIRALSVSVMTLLLM